MSMLERDVEIVNKLGLHARASAKLTQTAGSFDSEVWLSRNGRRVNGKSIMGVMMLAAARGTSLKIDVEGPDEAEAMHALVELIEDKFGEGE
jgi:phosphocarrier protein